MSKYATYVLRYPKVVKGILYPKIPQHKPIYEDLLFINSSMYTYTLATYMRLNFLLHPVYITTLTGEYLIL